MSQSHDAVWFVKEAHGQRLPLDTFKPLALLLPVALRLSEGASRTSIEG
jgi:hypothetical protein